MRSVKKMMRLIDATKLEKHFEYCIDECKNTNQFAGNFEIALKATKNQPTIEANLGHGKWIYTAVIDSDLSDVKCSSCCYTFITTADIAVEISEFKYCPNCGAKMNGGNGNES